MTWTGNGLSTLRLSDISAATWRRKLACWTGCQNANVNIRRSISKDKIYIRLADDMTQREASSGGEKASTELNHISSLSSPPPLHPPPNTRFTVTHLNTAVQSSSVQDGIYALQKARNIMRSSPSVRGFSNFAFETVPKFVWLTMVLSRPFNEDRLSSASSFHGSLLQAIDGVMSLALCPQVVSQASQHFRSSKNQATCEGCFACQSICSLRHVCISVYSTRKGGEGWGWGGDGVECCNCG